MERLIPKNTFLRVADKFVCRFVNRDKAVGTNATLLYKRLFEECADSGQCRLAQRSLSEECKFSVRALQNALRQLAALGYIHVQHDAGGCSTYVLLCSEHVKRQIADYELINPSSWYPRDVYVPTQYADMEPGQSSDETPAADGHPPHQVQGGYAPGAYPSYNVYKNEKNKIPPTPLLETVSGQSVAPDTGRKGGAFFSGHTHSHFSGSAALIRDFQQLWATWPVQEARHGALRVYCALARAGKLPALSTLLAMAAHLRAHDDRWRRGFVPYLVNWLRGERWQEVELPAMPCRQPSAGVSLNSVPTEAPTPTLPPLSQEMADTLENLCRIWPEATARAPLGPLLRSLAASGRLPDGAGLLATAHSYLHDNSLPGSLVSWLRRLTGGPAHEKNNETGTVLSSEGGIPGLPGRASCAA